jgi:hypothetical protein
MDVVVRWITHQVYKPEGVHSGWITGLVVVAQKYTDVPERHCCPWEYRLVGHNANTVNVISSWYFERTHAVYACDIGI